VEKTNHIWWRMKIYPKITRLIYEEYGYGCGYIEGYGNIDGSGYGGGYERGCGYGDGEHSGDGYFHFYSYAKDYTKTIIVPYGCGELGEIDGDGSGYTRDGDLSDW